MPLTSAHQVAPVPANPGYLQILPVAPCGDTVTLKLWATGLSYRREQIEAECQTLGMSVSEQTTAWVLTTLDFSFYDNRGPYLY